MPTLAIADRRPTFRAFLLLLNVAVLGFLSLRVSALPTFPPIVSSTYTLKAGGKDAQAVTSCTFCHAQSGPPKLNPYGKSVREALKQAGTKMLTAAILHALDNQDSDGDGATNAAEIAADTLPGDPASKPAGAPAPPVAVTSTPSGTAPAEAEPGLFDLRTLLFPKHAQHRVLVHFPIALLVMSLLFDLLAYRTKNEGMAIAARYNLAFAGITAPLALVSGILAWRIAYAGAALTGNLLYHLVLACVTTALVWLLWRLRGRETGVLSAEKARVYAFLGLIAFVLIALTGHIGGALVSGS